MSKLCGHSANPAIAWLIVIAGTFIVGLVLVSAACRCLRAERNEKAALLAELESANQVAEMIERIRIARRGKDQRSWKFEARTVDDESLPALRGKLVDLAKETGCSIRRLNVGASSSRPWHQGDNPIARHGGRHEADERNARALRWNGGR